MRPKPRSVSIPPAVVKNFLGLNLLIILTLAFSAFGLHYFLRPKALPALAHTGGHDQRSHSGIMVFWEIETERARWLLYKGMPILKRRNNP